MELLHVCEVCGTSEVLDSDDAFNAGWDYPPRMGAFGVVSPRTCGRCGMDETLWWAVMMDNLSFEDLNDKQKATLERIANEPESILVK